MKKTDSSVLKRSLELTKKLIAVPSTADNKEALYEVLNIVKKELDGFTIEEFESNSIKSILVHNAKPGTKKFKIILNGHLDVLPAAKKQFKPFEKNGKLYGRGAHDMKAATAVYAILFKDLAKQIPYPIALQVVTDEESGGTDGTAYQIQQGIRADFVIIGECNTNFQITNQAKGAKVVKLTAKGKTSHAAYLWKGDNAIVKMNNVLEKIAQVFQAPENETHESTIAITKISTTNSAINSIPSDCTVHLDIRFLEKDKESIIANLKALIPDSIVIESFLRSHPHYVDPKNSYIKKLKEITTSVIGEDLPLRFAHGTSDAPFYSAVNCDAIEFGPIGGHPHGDDEWADVESLGQYYEILKKFLLSVK